MGRNSLKTAVVLAALAILMLVPLVEANYMVGNPYVGTTQKMHESRYFGGFYEGRVMFPLPRDRMVKRYISGNAAGIAWQPSRASSSNAQPANDNVVSPTHPSLRETMPRLRAWHLQSIRSADPKRQILLFRRPPFRKDQIHLHR